MTGSTLRPEYLFDSVNQLVPGGNEAATMRQDRRLSGVMGDGVVQCVK